MSFSLAGRSTDPAGYEAGKQVRGHHRIVVIRCTGTTRDGMGSRRHPTQTDGRWSARVLSELAGQRGCLILVIGDRRSAIGDRREPASHEPTSPDPFTQLTRLLTNLPGDAPPVFTVAISRRACSSCAWQAS
jgi:hypothetical protein